MCRDGGLALCLVRLSMSYFIHDWDRPASPGVMFETDVFTMYVNRPFDKCFCYNSTKNILKILLSNITPQCKCLWKNIVFLRGKFCGDSVKPQTLEYRTSNFFPVGENKNVVLSTVCLY